MRQRIRTLLTHERDHGASAIEYGLLIAGIAIAIIASVFFLGDSVSQDFSNVGSSVSNAT